MGFAHFYGVHDMRLGNEQVLPAVIVVIEEPHSPSGVELRNCAQSGAIRRIVKSSIPQIREQRVSLIGEICNDEVGPSIIVIVGTIDAHARKGSTTAVYTNTRHHADLLESTIALVAKQELRHGVIGNHNVRPTVTVEVADRNAEALARLLNTCLLRNQTELAITVVVIEERRDRLEYIWVTVGTIASLMFAAVDVVKRPFQVSGDDEIQPTIFVIVEPCSAGRPTSTGHSCAIGDIGKGSVAIVVVQSVAAKACNEDVLVAVIVVIGYRDASRVSLSTEPRRFGDVFKSKATPDPMVSSKYFLDVGEA